MSAFLDGHDQLEEAIVSLEAMQDLVVEQPRMHKIGALLGVLIRDFRASQHLLRGCGTSSAGPTAPTPDGGQAMAPDTTAALLRTTTNTPARLPRKRA